MGLKQKEKAAMINRLISVYSNSSVDKDVCLSVIAICMLLNIHTDEELTRRGSTRQVNSKEVIKFASKAANFDEVEQAFLMALNQIKKTSSKY